MPCRTARAHGTAQFAHSFDIFTNEVSGYVVINPSTRAPPAADRDRRQHAAMSDRSGHRTSVAALSISVTLWRSVVPVSSIISGDMVRRVIHIRAQNVQASKSSAIATITSAGFRHFHWRVDVCRRYRVAHMLAYSRNWWQRNHVCQSTPVTDMARINKRFTTAASSVGKLNSLLACQVLRIFSVENFV